MRYFDYSFLGNGGLIPADIVNLMADIYGFRSVSEVQKEMYKDKFDRLSSIAKVLSVKSSNEMEGIRTTDERLLEIVNNNSAPLDHNEKEIAGYKDAFSLVLENYDEYDFCTSDILFFHSILMRIADYTTAGKFKTSNNVIEAITNGRREVRFIPVPAKDVPEEMDQLTLAYYRARDDSNIRNLLLIPCVILDFLCIHPFSDGNGRISRLLSLLLLFRNGFDVVKPISFEEQTKKRSWNYYQALRLSSEGWHENKNDYFPFVREFLTVVFLCYLELEKSKKEEMLDTELDFCTNLT